MKRSLLVVLALAVACGAPRAALSEVDLSPGSWPPGELERYTELNQRGQRDKAPATGREGMVVGTTGALAVRAGIEALRQGGSAADAALATTLAQVALAAGSWVSYAGGLQILHYDAATGRVRSLDGGFNTLLHEDDPLSIPAHEPSGRSALVSGFMAGVEEAHRRWGVLPFRELFAPAIWFAEEGFPIDAELAATIEFRADVLRRRPETRRIFFRADGSPWGRGDILLQPDLARTLRRVARQGAAYMYTGPWAEELVAALAAEGGRMTLEDLERYTVLVKKPKRARYRGLKILGPAPPGVGGKFAARAMKALKRHDLAGDGHYTESADTLHAMLEATRAIYDSVPPRQHSDGVIAIDASGDAVALLHSINTTAWGLTGIFVGGVSISDNASNQQLRVHRAGPGNRLWNPVNPLIVTKKKRFVLASSAIGSGLFEATIQGLVNVLDFRMTPDEAIDTPIFRAPERLEDDSIGDQLVTRGDFPADLLDAVRARGIPIEERTPIDPTGRGYWIGALRDLETGELSGATTRFFNGIAEGY